MGQKYPREETQVSLSEFARTVCNKATRTKANGSKVSYYKGRTLLGYNIELPHRPGGGMQVKCVRVV